MSSLLSTVDHLGKSVVTNLIYTGRVFRMVYLSIRAAAVDQAQGFRTILGLISEQIYFTGFQALPLMTVLAVATGGVIILQSSYNLSLLGGSQMIGDILIAVVVRELGPLITALVVVSRSGTAVASEVGNMRANREIEALETMGINPLSFIVFPRLIGGIVSVICLGFYFTVVALMGGFVVTRLLHELSMTFYLQVILEAITMQDLALFLLKSLFSGTIVFVVCCYQGMAVRSSHTEVPIVTTQAVVKSIIYVVVFNLAVTVLFYVEHLTKAGVL